MTMDKLHILTLSGWTQPVDALRAMVPHAQVVDYVDVTEPSHIAEQLARSEYDMVIGWSLGAILARQLLHHGHVKANALVSIASPLQFVRDHRVHDAMPLDTFEQFYANYRDDTERTVKRFHGLLVKDDIHHKTILANLTHHPRVHDADAWLIWMDYLRDYSALDHHYSNLPPTLIIHGNRDAIVPVTQAYHLSEYIEHASLHVIHGSGHAPHWHNPQLVKQLITSFYQASTV